MAHFFELPVYKKAIELATALTMSTQKTPRDIRFTRVSSLKNKALDIAKTIAFANGELDNHTRREKYIRECLEVLHEMEIDVRVLKDAHLIPESGFNAITAVEGRLGSQLHSWLNSTVKKKESAESKTT